MLKFVLLSPGSVKVLTRGVTMLVVVSSDDEEVSCCGGGGGACLHFLLFTAKKLATDADAEKNLLSLS